MRVHQTLLLLLTVLATPVLAQSSLPLTPYGQLEPDAEASIVALETELFSIMSEKGIEAAFAFATLDYAEQAEFAELIRKADATCKKWYSLSEGETKIFSAHVVQKRYYSLSDDCQVQWTVLYMKYPSGWSIKSVRILAPEDAWEK